MKNSKALTTSESAQIAVPELPQRPQPLRIVRQYVKVLAGGALLGLAIGGGLAMTRQKTYTSQSTLLFPTSVPTSALGALTGSGGGDPGLPLLGGALTAPQLGSNANTAVLIVQSQRLEKQVIKKLDLGKKWQMNDYGMVVKKFENNLDCNPGKSGELYVSFKDPSRDLAYKVTTEVVSELKDLIVDLRMDPASDNVKFLQRKVNDTRKRLSAAELKFATYQRQHRLLDLTSQATALAQRYADLQKDAAAAQLESDIASHQATLLSAGAKEMVTSAIDPNPTTGNTLSPLYQRVKEAESQLALLRYQLTDDHPQVQEQKRVLQQAQRQLKAETSRQLAAVREGVSPSLNGIVIQAAASKARAAGLKQAVANVAKEIDKLPVQAAGFMNLQGQVQGYVQALTLYQQELEKAKILTQSRGPAIIELDPAEPALRPNSTGRVTLILLCLMLGLGLASVFPYREWQRRNDQYEDMLFVMRENQLMGRPAKAALEEGATALSTDS
jgi:uncharacterized protein involved in exopolysaccharide biosynthesis